MNVCQPHWDELRGAIDDRGLSHLVAKDGVAAARNLEAQLQGTDAEENYDPLMSAYWAIMANSLKCWGLGALADDFGCPLCALDRHAAECAEEGCARNTGADWIRFASDGQLQAARDLGLVGKPN